MQKRSVERSLLLRKKAETMGMPFEFIFALLLIAVFLVVVFFVIRHFLNVQDCAQIGLFTRELQEKTDEVWRAESAQQLFEGSLPATVEYVCFANFSKSKNLQGLNAQEREGASKVYEDMSPFYKFNKANLYLFPRSASCGSPYATIKHVNLSASQNPLCFTAQGKVKIALTKGFRDNLVIPKIPS